MTKVRVMVVDDNQPLAELLVEYLEALGYEASSLFQVRSLEPIRAWRPDLLLLDVNMPSLRGDEVLRAMRECPVLRDTPVIMITGAPTSAEDALHLAQLWLYKPVDLEVLSQHIAELTRSPDPQWPRDQAASLVMRETGPRWSSGMLW